MSKTLSKKIRLFHLASGEAACRRLREGQQADVENIAPEADGRLGGERASRLGSESEEHGPAGVSPTLAGSPRGSKMSW